MSTEIEDRLTAALGARAEQVTAADLPPLVVPGATVVPFVRRPLVWAVAAAACVALAVPFVVENLDRGGDNISPAPSPDATTPTFFGASLTGDLDGDGTDETVSIDEHGIISVVLASSSSGTPLTADAGADGSTLVALVKLDDSGAQSVFTGDRGGTGRVFRVTGDGLVQVEAEGGGPHWFPQRGELLTAARTGIAHIMSMDSWRLMPNGKLGPVPLGEYCDFEIGAPRPCGNGDGVTSDGLQVALFPESNVVPDGQSLPIAIDGGGGPGTITLDGSALTVDFPGGSPAEQVTIPGQGTNKLLSSFMPGVEVPGIVVRQTRSDGYVVFTIVTWRAGHLTVLDTGEQISSWDDHTSWMSTTGRLFTMSPDVNGDGASVQQWSMTETGVVAQDVTAPDGRRQICFGEGDPPTYDAC